MRSNYDTGIVIQCFQAESRIFIYPFLIIVYSAGPEQGLVDQLIKLTANCHGVRLYTLDTFTGLLLLNTLRDKSGTRDLQGHRTSSTVRFYQ